MTQYVVLFGRGPIIMRQPTLSVFARLRGRNFREGSSWSKAAIIAAFAFYTSTSLASGPPVSYGQWSASGGTISDSACGGVGVSCTLIAEDDGFRYEYIETPDGTFSRLILTDSGASGDSSTLSFASENFTPFLQRFGNSSAFELPGSGLIAQGVAGQQVIRDGSMESSAEIQRGFARDLSTAGLGSEEQATNAWGIKLLQTNVDPDITSGFSAIVYNEVNTLPAATPDSDAVRGKAIDIWQTVTDTTTGDKQEFDYRTREGYKGWHFFLCCTDPLTKGGSVTLDGTTVSWAPGEAVSAVWIGSNINGDLFGYESVSDSTTASQSSLTDTGPFSWQASSSADMNWPLNTWLAPLDPSRTSPPSF